jgi:hypothetical protein
MPVGTDKCPRCKGGLIIASAEFIPGHGELEQLVCLACGDRKDKNLVPQIKKRMIATSRRALTTFFVLRPK